LIDSFLFVADGFEMFSAGNFLLIFPVSAFAGALVGDWLQNELKKEWENTSKVRRRIQRIG